ncbi:glycosyltransferase family 4 protein [Clostridium felsineum]|uniref:glycosyltransferase family 4 protein n=1 Tax=Clostridium felsineum TaxID=36839 RepID=UPI00098C1B91|nr:glycosyltransferase family 4 protein [Clostridium felsineum]URZ14872.1 D-inositol-3-phosphate glycosyltransferase [Clostridium felsineum DSM 794]
MNVLFVSDLGSLGGGETSLFNLLQEFSLKNKKYGINSSLMCRFDGKLVDKLKKINVNCEVLDFKTAFKSFKVKEIIKTIKSIKEFLYRNNIEVIQCNEWTSAVLFSIISKVSRKNCKIIWICHGQWYKFNFIKRLLVNLFIDKIISVSDSVQENLIKNKINRNKLLKERLGINLDKFRNGNGKNIREELNIGKEEKLLGVIARFQPIKGQKLMVDTAKAIVEAGYKNYKFLLVGDSIFNNPKDAQYKNEVIEKIKEYKLEENIILLGERNDVPDILAALDVLIVPSINESFGMVVIEAFAAGCTVISTPSDGPMEIIENGFSGVIIEERNSENLKNAILKLVEENSTLKVMKVNAKRESEKYDIASIAKFYCKEYES